MSSLTNNSPFSLDEINLRKKLVFPDGTIQSTAYTGAVGGPTLAEVLADSNDANLLSIDNLSSLEINNVPVVTFAAGAVTVVPLLDVTSIRFPTDNAIQTQAPRFIERITTAVVGYLSTNVPSFVFSTAGPLLPGSYAISGFVQNDAVGGGATTDIQYGASIQNSAGGDVYRIGFTGISTQSDGQLPQPYLPISGFFRNTTGAGEVFSIYQRCVFTGGYQTQNATADIYYLGA